MYPSQPASPARMSTRRKVAYALSAVWIALGLTSGIGGALVMAAVLAMGVGMAALIVGHARWAFVRSRKAGALVLVAGLVFGGVIGNITAPASDDDQARAQDASLTASASATPGPTSDTPALRGPATESKEPNQATTAPIAPAAEPASPAAVVVTVTRVVDGDTVDVSTGQRIRVIGIDTPEVGACGYAEAASNMAALVLGKQVALTSGARDDADKYDRLLRYLDVAGVDAGLDQINKGFAVARYDSRDGYGAHAREQQYIAADAATANVACQPAPTKPPAPAPVTTKPVPPAPETAKPVAPAPPPGAGSGCHPNYTGACLPIVADLDCSDVPRPVTVVGSDPYRLDRDKDGIGCE